MTPLRTLTFAAAAFFFGALGAHADLAPPPPKAPEEVLTQLYDDYLAVVNAGGIADMDATLKAHAEPALWDAYDAAMKATPEDEVPVINGDIFLDAQDWDKPVVATVTPVSSDGKTAVVKVAVRIFDDQVRTLTYAMSFDGERWLIADIDFGEAVTLKGLLAPPPAAQ